MRADFSLPPKERAVYGATITARSIDTGETLTLARTGMTAVEATREIVARLDMLDGNFRVVSISTPNSIQRDMYASRITLGGGGDGELAGSPEQWLLTRVKRIEMLHPSLVRMVHNNRSPVKHRER